MCLHLLGGGHAYEGSLLVVDLAEEPRSGLVLVVLVVGRVLLVLDLGVGWS
mgnify:CR=1 FL=1